MGLGRFCSNFTPIFTDISQQWAPADSGHRVLATQGTAAKKKKKNHTHTKVISLLFTQHLRNNEIDNYFISLICLVFSPIPLKLVKNYYFLKRTPLSALKN